MGGMVLVPFGRGKSRARIGVILGIHSAEEENKNIKPIYDVAPKTANLTPELLKIVEYLKENTFCTWYEAVKTVLPFGAQYKAIKTQEGWVLKQQLQRYTQKVYSLTPSIKKLVTQQMQHSTDELIIETKKISQKQKDVLFYLLKGTQTQEDILNNCNVSRSVLTTLTKHSYITDDDLDKTVLVGKASSKVFEPIELTPEQQTITNDLCAQTDTQKYVPALLYGVTSSGKTLIFVMLIDYLLKQNKTAIVLVPEISLAPQMINRLRAYFGNLVAVQHSRLSNTERLLQWQQIKKGQAKVVVGTRSAIFAPLENIGAIIVDEEQERTYQSENAPRYNALDIAKWRALYHKTLVVFSSATPLVTDYYAALQNKYKLYTLPQRYKQLPLPTVEIIDMHAERMKGNLSDSLSEPLLQAIAAAIAQEKQVILLLNRRGYQRVAMCDSCGEVVKCPYCSVPMVYHKKENKLLCHYCGHTLTPAPTKCAFCGGTLHYSGFGTQRVEEELQTYIPNIRILRMDADSTGAKHAHEEFLEAFENGEYDLLLGTQMVAKGLDFGRVSLVGVLGIDSLLFSQSYSASETAFSLITQVIGRCGRKENGAKALIQTVDPQNDILQLAAKQDYNAFYEEAILIRKLALYPPFCSLCMVGFISATEHYAVELATYFAHILAQNAAKNKDIPLRILGPVPMNILQVGGNFRYRIILKCKNNKIFRALLQTTLQQVYKQNKTHKVSIFVDFNATLDM